MWSHKQSTLWEYAFNRSTAIAGGHAFKQQISKENAGLQTTSDKAVVSTENADELINTVKYAEVAVLAVKLLAPDERRFSVYAWHLTLGTSVMLTRPQKSRPKPTTRPRRARPRPRAQMSKLKIKTKIKNVKSQDQDHDKGGRLRPRLSSLKTNTMTKNGKTKNTNVET